MGFRTNQELNLSTPLTAENIILSRQMEAGRWEATFCNLDGSKPKTSMARLDQQRNSGWTRLGLSWAWFQILKPTWNSGQVWASGYDGPGHPAFLQTYVYRTLYTTTNYPTSPPPKSNQTEKFSYATQPVPSHPTDLHSGREFKNWVRLRWILFRSASSLPAYNNRAWIEPIPKPIHLSCTPDMDAAYQKLQKQKHQQGEYSIGTRDCKTWNSNTIKLEIDNDTLL